MQDLPKSPTAPQSFDILLFEQFSNHCLANTVEPLRAANTLARTPLYSWRFYTPAGEPVTSSSGLPVAPNGALQDSGGDTLVIMPSYGVRELGRWPVTSLLRGLAGRYRRLAGLDMGGWLLAQAGLLDGHRATIHWEELTAFAEAFPEVEVVRERFVIDRDRITCSGALAAFDLVLHLITQSHGALLGVEVAQYFMSRDGPRSHAGPFRPGSRPVDRALSVMQEHLEHPLTIAEIARRAGCTQKTLEARMREDLGATPQAVYRRLRLNLARKLAVDTEMKVGEIACRCGYENASAMTRAFKTEFGHSPQEMRQIGQ